VRYAFTVIVVLFMLSVPADALDGDKIEKDMLELIPGEALEYADADELRLISEGGEIRFASAAESLKKMFASLSTDIVKNISALCVFMVISAVYKLLSDTFGTGTMKNVLEMTVALSALYLVYGIMYMLFDSVRNVLNILSAFSSSTLPIMTLLYGSGGGISTAAVNSSAMMLALDIIELLCIKFLFPLVEMCFCIAVASGFINTVDIHSILKFVKGFILSSLALFMTLFCAILYYNTEIAQSADGLALKTAKFAASSAIPIVGGAISEAAKTLGGSLSYLKTTVGGLGITVIFLIIMPTLIKLLLYKTGFSLAVSLGNMCGNTKMSGFVSEMASLIDICLAILSACSAMFILIFTLLIKSTVG